MRKFLGVLFISIGAIAGIISFLLILFLNKINTYYEGKEMGNEATGYWTSSIVGILFFLLISVIGIIGGKRLLRKNI